MNSTAWMSSQQGGGESSGGGGGGASIAKPAEMSHAAVSAKGSGMGRSAKRTPQKSSGGSSNNSFQIVHAHVVTCTFNTQTLMGEFLAVAVTLLATLDGVHPLHCGKLSLKRLH
jgi:hypothetical protein